MSDAVQPPIAGTRPSIEEGAAQGLSLRELVQQCGLPAKPPASGALAPRVGKALSPGGKKVKVCTICAIESLGPAATPETVAAISQALLDNLDQDKPKRDGQNAIDPISVDPISDSQIYVGTEYGAHYAYKHGPPASFSCDYCTDSRHKRKCDLLSHYKSVHKMTAPQFCDEFDDHGRRCNMVCWRKDRLKRHSRKHSKKMRPTVSAKQQKSRKMILENQCMICLRATNAINPTLRCESSLRDHVRERHPRRYYRCPGGEQDCRSAVFDTEDLLELHMRLNHGGKSLEAVLQESWGVGSSNGDGLPPLDVSADLAAPESSENYLFEGQPVYADTLPNLPVHEFDLSSPLPEPPLRLLDGNQSRMNAQVASGFQLSSDSESLGEHIDFSSRYRALAHPAEAPAALADHLLEQAYVACQEPSETPLERACYRGWGLLPLDSWTCRSHFFVVGGP